MTMAMPLAIVGAAVGGILAVPIVTFALVSDWKIDVGGGGS